MHFHEQAQAEEPALQQVPPLLLQDEVAQQMPLSWDLVAQLQQVPPLLQNLVAPEAGRA